MSENEQDSVGLWLAHELQKFFPEHVVISEDGVTVADTYVPQQDVYDSYREVLQKQFPGQMDEGQQHTVACFLCLLDESGEAGEELAQTVEYFIQSPSDTGQVL